MARLHELESNKKLEPLVVSRTFPAPRDLVFKAWSSAEHIKRWFCPQGCSVPEAEVDFRPGGVFAVCMRMPTGEDHWSKGTYDEISPPNRLAFSGAVIIGGETKFTVYTTVTFEDDGAGTRMTVRQAYQIHDPAYLFAIEGSAEGWRTTLDKLEREGRAHRGRHAPLRRARDLLAGARLWRYADAGVSRPVGSGGQGQMVRGRRGVGGARTPYGCPPRRA